MMQHFLLTRFNVVGAPSGSSSELIDPRYARRAQRFRVNREGWLATRVKFFERFCLPSVVGQSHRAFTWLVYFDVNTSRVLREKVAVWQLRCPQFMPVFVGPLTPLRVAESVRNLAKDEWITTTRLDSDDGLHRDFISSVLRSTRKVREAINVLKGYRWHRGKVFPWSHDTNMFMSLVERRTPALSTVLGYRHTEIVKAAPLRQLSSNPFWLSVIHDASLTKGLAETPRGAIPESVVAQQFCIDTGVKL